MIFVQFKAPFWIICSWDATDGFGKCCHAARNLVYLQYQPQMRVYDFFRPANTLEGICAGVEGLAQGYMAEKTTRASCSIFPPSMQATTRISGSPSKSLPRPISMPTHV